MRVRDLLGCALLVGALAGASLGLQELALRPPPRGDVEAVRILRRLLSEPVVRSVERVNGGHPFPALCRQDWVGRARGALVSFRGGARLLDLEHHILVRGGPARFATSRGRVSSLDLAGCSRVLEQVIGADLERRRPIRVALVRIDGAQAYRLLLGKRGERVQLYVSRATALPIEVHVTRPGFQGWSDVGFGESRHGRL